MLQVGAKIWPKTTIKLWRFVPNRQTLASTMAAPAPAPAAAAAAAVKRPPFSWDEPGKKVLLETGMTIIPAYVAGGVSTPSRMFNKSSQSVPTDFRNAEHAAAEERGRVSLSARHRLRRYGG